MPESEAIFITYQLLCALDYLHNQQNTIHRDLKLDNVLLEEPIPGSRIFLCDFGIAKRLSTLKQRTTTVVGTVEYSAPEIFSTSLELEEEAASFTLNLKQNMSNKDGYDYKCDMWSLGVVVHILLSGISPFYNEETDIQIVKAAATGILNLDKFNWHTVSYEAKDFVKNLLQVNPSVRFNVVHCFEHPWIASRKRQLDQIYELKIRNNWCPAY